MKDTDKKNNTLIIGIGNVGRQDDALGWLFLDYIQNENLAGLDIEYRYQLQIEDAELIKNYKHVVFIDACKEKIENGFFIKECSAKEKHEFSTHSLSPETVISLCKKLYQHNPIVHIIGIQGYEWDLEMGVTDKAYSNYKKAIDYFLKTIDDYTDIKKKQ